jgi:putative membrane protein insertion efficiency factor
MVAHMKRLLRSLIRLYQLCFSPVIGPHCRFYPTCSEYGMEAIQKHGAARGAWMTARRVCRCHPWHSGGLDPVP